MARPKCNSDVFRMRIPPKLKTEIERLARERGITTSSLCRGVMRQAIADHDANTRELNRTPNRSAQTDYRMETAK